MGERLHHTRKKVLLRTDVNWRKLSYDNVQFIEEVVDSCGGTLSEHKWKKLYACLAQLGSDTGDNYRVYLSAEGFYFDTTTHNLVSEEELGNEYLHQDAIDLINNTTTDEVLKQLKRWKLEIEQLTIKIKQLTEKRDEMASKYKTRYEQLMKDLAIG